MFEGAHRKFWFFVFLLLLASARLFPEPENPLRPDWQHYHSSAEANALLEAWSEAFPNLTRLYSIGETLRATPLLVLEISNKQTGEAADKPGYYYDGNIHAGELTGAEVALHFAWHLLHKNGKDDRVTRLLDTRVLYVRPKFNPDGADLAMAPPYPRLRSTPRPYDEDQDGLADEDPGNDLNGDGAVTQMRVVNPKGVWKTDPQEARIMVRRTEGDLTGTFYDLYTEGLDDDSDGRFNEDGLGGIDMNRNFPRNWGLEFEQSGAGPYPLSEPETRATIEFLNSHRNVTGVFHGHTSGGFLFRLPSTAPWDAFNLADQRLILELSEKYRTTTGQPVRPSYSNPRVHRHGTLISWSYWDFGVVGFVPEFWGGAGQDYDGDGRISGRETLRWQDEELSGSAFVDWAEQDHPTLGKVEIGGWKRRFVFQNPPPQLLRKEIEQYVPWMMWLAEISPRVVIAESTVTLIAPDVSKITLTIENEGYLPTNITQRALDARLAVEVRVLAETEDASLLAGQSRTDLGHLPGSRDSQPLREGSPRRSVEYVVKHEGANPSVSITVTSEKGGTVRRKIELGR